MTDTSQSPTVHINHVSVSAPDLEASVAWYGELFGARPIPTPNFGFPVQWLGIGDTQLHLFNRDMEPPSHHHFAVTVDEIEPVYARAAERGAFDRDAFGHHLYELPGDTVQLYLRDPGGNLVEVDSPGVGRLPGAIRSELKRLADVHPQDEENESARLYVRGAGAAAV
jgi:catechol 2,3-dioxygenase-like lactoylglutathione lyase family enzyme